MIDLNWIYCIEEVRTHEWQWLIASCKNVSRFYRKAISHHKNGVSFTIRNLNGLCKTTERILITVASFLQFGTMKLRAFLCSVGAVKSQKRYDDQLL